MQNLKPSQFYFANLPLLKNNGAYSEISLFMGYFQSVPNFIYEEGIDCLKLKREIEEHYAANILKKHSISRPNSTSTETKEDDIYYFLVGDLLLYLDSNQSKAKLLYGSEMNAQSRAYWQLLQSHKNRKDNQIHIHLVTRSYSSLILEAMEIERQQWRLSENYNEDFTAVNQLILDRLQRPKDKGIVLLHGQPGTGKTSYIRYLICEVKKKVIFLPPAMAGSLTDPNFISILTDNPNSILVIEDAERALMQRDAQSHSPVSTLLNISDGLLADCLNIQIICSFNTDLANIDKALLRKGRLIAKYDFQALAVEKAQALSTQLGFSKRIMKPMSLSEIYGQEEQSFTEVLPKKAIGF